MFDKPGNRCILRFVRDNGREEETKMKTLDKIRFQFWVSHVDDERNIGNSIIIVLAEGFYFMDDPGCGVKGFDTVSEALRGVRRNKVYYGKKSLL